MCLLVVIRVVELGVVRGLCGVFLELTGLPYEAVDEQQGVMVAAFDLAYRVVVDVGVVVEALEGERLQLRHKINLDRIVSELAPQIQAHTVDHVLIQLAIEALYQHVGLAHHDLIDLSYVHVEPADVPWELGPLVGVVAFNPLEDALLERCLEVS